MSTNHRRPPLPLSKEAVDTLLASLLERDFHDLHDAVLLTLELGLTPRQLEQLRWSNLRFPPGKVIIGFDNEDLLLPSSPVVDRVFACRRHSSPDQDLLFAVPMHSLNRQLESHSISIGLGLITMSTIQTMFTEKLLTKLRNGELADFLLLARIG